MRIFSMPAGVARIVRLIAARGLWPLAEISWHAILDACHDNRFQLRAVTVRRSQAGWTFYSGISRPSAIRVEIDGYGIFSGPWQTGAPILPLGGLLKDTSNLAAIRLSSSWRPNRWLLQGEIPDNAQIPQIWVCGYGSCRWKWPSFRQAFDNFRQTINGNSRDFRRRISSLPAAAERQIPENAGQSIVWLASSGALNNSSVQNLLLGKAASGVLDILFPGSRPAFPSASFTVVAGLGNDPISQSFLQDLSTRGISLGWLSASEGATVATEEAPLISACALIGFPSADGASDMTIRPLSFPVPPTVNFHRWPVTRPRLRVISYRWHVPHQYELYKLDADITLVTDLGEGSCRWWDLGQRPLPGNVRFSRWRDIVDTDFDMAWLHFDENALEPSLNQGMLGSSWGQTFRYLREHLSIPVIAVCHGAPRATARFSGADALQAAQAYKTRLVDYLGNVPVVINSFQAQKEWGFSQSRVIWHGFAPEEFVCRSCADNEECRILTLPETDLHDRPVCRGTTLLQQLDAHLSVPIHRLKVAEPSLLLAGNEYARAKFTNYIAALHRHTVYVNPTLHSPMPRSRGEAMLCGLISASMDNHDVDLFIKNGVNGFYAASVEELAEYLGYLLGHRGEIKRMCQASRDTAVSVFHIDRYLSDWRALIRETLGHAVI